MFDSIFKGKSRNIGGPDLERLVELGFLRFATIDNGKADEPLALLTAASCFSQTTWTIEHFLREALSNTHDRDKGLAFEQFSTYALALAFKKPKSSPSLATIAWRTNMHSWSLLARRTTSFDSSLSTFLLPGRLSWPEPFRRGGDTFVDAEPKQHCLLFPGPECWTGRHLAAEASGQHGSLSTCVLQAD